MSPPFGHGPIGEDHRRPRGPGRLERLPRHDQGTGAMLAVVAMISVFFAVAMRFGVWGVSAILLLLEAVVFGLAMRRNRPTMATIGCMLMLFSFVPPAVCNMEPRWIGRHAYPLSVRLVDWQSGSPVPGASVRVFDPDVNPDASGVETNLRGMVTITTVFTTVGTDNIWGDKGSIYLWMHTIQVAAEGFVPVKEPLEHYTGDVWDLYGRPIPLVTLALERAGAAEANPDYRPQRSAETPTPDPERGAQPECGR